MGRFILMKGQSNSEDVTACINDSIKQKLAELKTERDKSIMIVGNFKSRPPGSRDFALHN
jgi:hypothetical protein